jgi:PEP-CTERM motif
MRSKSLLGAAFVIAGSYAVPASAALVTFSGEDIMATTASAHPISAAAAASFDAAVTGLGGGSLVTFESSPLGSFSNLAIAPGVTMNGTDINGNNQTIRNTSNFPVAPTLDGYNTTASGAKFVEVMGGTLTISFTTPIDAFGAYLSGVQHFTTDTVLFSDGTSQTIDIPETGTSNSVGALDFVGFTDVGKSITSVTINAGTNGFDDIGVDDVRFAAVPVPEPTSLAIFGTALLGVGEIRRRRKNV